MKPNPKTPIRILSVEDNAADKRLIQELLKMSKFQTEVEFVNDGVEALDYLYRRGTFADREHPDLILLDLTLPCLDGHEVLATVKCDESLCHIPVLILTGSPRESDVQRSYQLHANTYIVKPFDIDDLAAVMRGIETYWSNIAELPKRAPAPALAQAAGDSRKF